MTSGATTEKKTAASNRVLTLRLGREFYALSVSNVRGIIQPLEISPVPRAPAEFLGVINLRGKIVPLIDLRIKFGLEFTGRTDRTCIVVVETESRPGVRKLTGLLVDEVQEVTPLNAADIEEAPSFGVSVDTSYIRGLAKTNSGVTILIDLERMLNDPKSAQPQ